MGPRALLCVCCCTHCCARYVAPCWRVLPQVCWEWWRELQRHGPTREGLHVACRWVWQMCASSAKEGDPCFQTVWDASAASATAGWVCSILSAVEAHPGRNTPPCREPHTLTAFTPLTPCRFPDSSTALSATPRHANPCTCTRSCRQVCLRHPGGPGRCGAPPPALLLRAHGHGGG